MHNHQHPMNQFNIDGRVEYRENICVHRGGTFTIKPGTEHIGSLTFQSGSTGYICGTHTGSLTQLRREKEYARREERYTSGSIGEGQPKSKNMQIEACNLPTLMRHIVSPK